MATPRPSPIRHGGTGPLTLSRPIAIIDLETTGTLVDIDRIVEIGILKVKPGGKMVHFRKRVKPGINIPREATDVHGIKNADVAAKPRFKAIARKILKFIRGCDIAGFNLKSFDLRILEAEFERAGIDFSCKGRYVIDAKEIYHFHEPRTLSAALLFYCQSKHGEAHSALDDACATWQVLKAQIEKYGLPRRVGKLDELMERARPKIFLDSGQWFCLRDQKVIFAKGQYRGERLSKVVKAAPDYLSWILGLKDIPKDTRNLIEERLH